MSDVKMGETSDVKSVNIFSLLIVNTINTVKYYELKLDYRIFEVSMYLICDRQGWSNLNVRSSLFCHNLHIKFLTILTHSFWNFSLISHKISHQIILFQ
jgi:hypothetical protein